MKCRKYISAITASVLLMCTVSVTAEDYTSSGTMEMVSGGVIKNGTWSFIKEATKGSLYLTGDGSNLQTYSDTSNEPWAESIPDTTDISFVKIGAISPYAFSKYPELSNVNFDNKLWYIKEGAFYDCDNLTKVVLPSSVVRVHPKAFADCDALKDVYFSSAATFYSDTFESSTCIHYPANDEMYQTAKGWGYNIILDESAPIIGDMYSMSDLKIDVDLGGLNFYTYSGAAYKPAVTITDKKGNIIDKSWYTLSYANNINAGKGIIKITGDNTHITGSSEKEFLIAAKNLNISDASLQYPSYTYTGTLLKPPVITSLPASEYKLEYTNDIDSRKGSVKVIGINNHAGSLTLSFGIKVPDSIPGDADGNKIITINDVLLIQQHIAGWGVTIDEKAANVDGDNRITINDVLLIQQFIAGWNVTLK